MNTKIFEHIMTTEPKEKEYSPEEEAFSINCLQEFIPRQYDVLKKMNINTLNDLLAMKTFDLIDHPYFINQNPEMLIRAVHLLGYSFQDEQFTEAAAPVRKRTDGHMKKRYS